MLLCYPVIQAIVSYAKPRILPDDVVLIYGGSYLIEQAPPRAHPAAAVRRSRDRRVAALCNRRATAS